MDDWGIRLDWLVKGCATAAAACWGGLIPLTQLLLVLMVIDIATGILGAIHRRELSSDISRSGMTKKAQTLLVVAACGAVEHYAASSIGNLPLQTAVAGFYAATEMISIIENASGTGLPIPKLLRDVLAKLSPEHSGAGK